MADVQNNPKLEIRLLGSVQAHHDGRELDLGGVLPKSLLAALVLSPGQTMPKDTVVEALWGADPPLTADRLVADYLSRLRAALGPAGGAIRLRAMRPGFRADLDPLAVDAHRLRDLIRRAERDRAAGDDEHATTLLRQALDLWPADMSALADLESAWLRGEARRLRGWRLDGLEQLARLHLDAGHPEQATALLRDVAPSLERENLTAAMIEALLGTGESTRAAGLARRAHETLQARGKQPGPALRGAVDAALGTRQGGPPRGPRQLPTDIALFTGRGDELDQLLALADSAGSGGSPGTVVISALDGMGGVGKTALAVRAAHRLAERYPDGQLFIDLYGYTQGTAPRDPGGALATLLGGLGVTAQHIPAQLDARAAFYRDRLADTRTLILLDNAADEAQVRPLLPATDTCLVLITSRLRFKALDDALPLSLGVLTLGEAVALLRKAARLAEHPRDEPLLEQAAELCGRLPLALVIAGALLRTGGKAWNLALLINRLAARLPGDELAGYTDGTRNLAAVFDLSYDALTRDQRLLFRRLSQLPGPEIDAYAAALLDSDPRSAERLLQQLADHSLLTATAPGRYRPHDLIRAHARTLAVALEPAPERDAALDRLLHYYAHTAQTASIPVARDPRPDPDSPAPAHAPVLGDEQAARAWLRTEHSNLDAAFTHAHTHALDAHAITLAAGLAEILRTDGPWTRALQVHQSAAERSGHSAALTDLGRVRLLIGDFPGAVAAHTEALEIYRALSNRLGQANALNDLGRVRQLVGDRPGSVAAHTEALEIYRTLGNRNGEANALTNLGRVRQLVGDFPGAVAAHTEALEIYRALSGRNGEAWALNHYAATLTAIGQRPRALTLYCQALAMNRELNKPDDEAISLEGIADHHLVAGDTVQGTEHLHQALEIYQRLGMRADIDRVHTRLAGLAPQ